jgi:uncharacterized RDD family membrane protein YckC
MRGKIMNNEMALRPEDIWAFYISGLIVLVCAILVVAGFTFHYSVLAEFGIGAYLLWGALYPLHRVLVALIRKYIWQDDTPATCLSV